MLAAFFRNLLRKKQTEQELDDELRAYLELNTAENMRCGMSPEGALQKARRDLGGMEQVKAIIGRSSSKAARLTRPAFTIPPITGPSLPAISKPSASPSGVAARSKLETTRTTLSSWSSTKRWRAGSGPMRIRWENA
jgi:hypothetical protein